MNDLELATGVIFGVTPRPLARTTLHPAAALEAALAPALERGRCFVSFSGGRDSSAVLAAATAVARRCGLDDPVPLTLRAAAVPSSDESDWQERVVARLRLGDWVRVEAGEDLDCVGPYARGVLSRHGLQWPFNAHFHMPLLELARGGTLLTGIGGDELWLASRAAPAGWRRRVLRRLPLAVRRAVWARRQPIGFPWLRESAREAARRAAAAEVAAVPRDLFARMAYVHGMHDAAAGAATLARLAADAGAAIAHPLRDRTLWAAVAAAAPRGGFADRDAALALVAGDRLPPALVGRRTKASFDGVFFTDTARAVARDWDGRGVPAAAVDAERLRAHWLGAATPDSHSLSLLQSAWLAQRAEQPLDRLAG